MVSVHRISDSSARLTPHISQITAQHTKHTHLMCECACVKMLKRLTELSFLSPRSLAGHVISVTLPQETVGGEKDRSPSHKQVEPSTGPWAASVIIVQRPPRLLPKVLCRIQNTVTQKDLYPLSRIDDSLDFLARGTVHHNTRLSSRILAGGSCRGDQRQPLFHTGLF